MLATAKVFANGHSQAIRLPKAFRVDVEEMWIARNDATGEITLKPKDSEALRKRRLDILMAAIAEIPLPEGFLSEANRQNPLPSQPFADWADTPGQSPPTRKAKTSAKGLVKIPLKSRGRV